jgi:dienelactone hydrolase
VVLGLVATIGPLAACGGSARQAVSTERVQPPAHKTLFGYDRAQPLRFVDRGQVNHGYPIAVDDVSYTSGRGRVAAYLVQPPATNHRLPAVIYLHGRGGDRKELLVPSTWLAARGAIALTITAPSEVVPQPPGLTAVAFLRWTVRTQVRDVVAVRRAVDLLARRKDVDPHRIGFVGWSAGSRTGAILAGVEPRLRALVLMSGGADPVQSYAALARPALRPMIRRYLGSIDPLYYIHLARRSTLFLEDGRSDAVVPRAALRALARAAPYGTRVHWYDAGHALDDAAYRDQLAWLAAKLRVTGPAVAGSATTPT